MSPVDPLEPSQTGFLMTKRPWMASKTASKLCLRPIPESAWKNGNFDPHKFIPQYSFDWSSLPDMKYTLTAHLPKAISGRNGKTPLRSQLKSISGTPMSNLSGCPAKNMGVQAVFIFGVPKWGSGPPRGAFWTKFQFFLVPAHDLCTEVPPCEFGPFRQIIHASRAFVVISGQICLQGRLWGISGMGLLTEKLF